MGSRTSDIETVPFESAEEAWFWFIQAQAARNDGARFVSGLGHVQRPCEPLDILNVLNRLYRQRRLLMDHMHVLRHYGRRMLAPDGLRVKEMRAHTLWHEAMDKLEGVLEAKGIVRKNIWAGINTSSASCMGDVAGAAE